MFSFNISTHSETPMDFISIKDDDFFNLSWNHDDVEEIRTQMVTLMMLKK